MTATPTPMPGQGLRPGDKLDKYEILEQIGAGGFSVVWKGYDRLINQHVAIKQVLLDPGADLEVVRERFRNEAEMQKRVAASCPHLVQLIDFIEEPRGMFIVMEFVQGMSLEQLMVNNPGPRDLRMALGYAAAVAVALDAIHNQGIIHRDLKPSNILITHDGNLKVCDFGLATMVADQATPTVGTVRYMAPELLNAEKGDPRADIYSLGVILYEMLIGRTNFNEAFKVVLRDQRNQSLRWMKWHTNLRVKAPSIKQFNPETPDAFVELVDRMMSKDAVQRIASASQLIETMRRQLQAPQPGAAAAGPVYDYAAAATGGQGMAMGDQTAVLPRNRKIIYIVAATAAFWVIAALVYFGIQSSSENKEKYAKEVAVLDDYFRLRKTMIELELTVDLDRVKWDVHDNTGKVVETKSKVFETAPTWPQLVDEWTDLESDVAAKKLNYLRVPNANKSASKIDDGIACYRAYARGLIALQDRQLEEARTHFAAAQKLDVIDTDQIERQFGEITRLSSYDESFLVVERLINEGKLLEAENEYTQFMRDLGHRLTPAQQEQWDQLDNRINARRQAAKVTKILAKAQESAKTDRAAAIEQLEEWLADNKDNPSRDVETYLTQLVSAVNFESTVTAGKDAEAGGDLTTAIEQYQKAIALNAAASEKLMLPSRITKLRARIAYDAGKLAFENEDYPTAVVKLREALSYDPDIAGAKAMLDKISSAGQMATLKKLAVAAYQNREYAKSINLWKQLRDEFDYDADEAASEIAKAEFQILLDRMEAAWRSGDEAAILAACDAVLGVDSTNERAALLKLLTNTRRLFRSRIVDAKDEFKNGDYGASKRHILKAIRIAETVEDLTIRNELLDEAKSIRDEVEYADAYAKARRDFERDNYGAALGWIVIALDHKKTDEASALKVKIDAAKKKQEAENG